MIVPLLCAFRAPLPWLVFVVLVSFAVACGPDTRPEEESATTPLPELEAIATFGCDDCAGAEQLARPGVTVGPSGRVYVGDAHEPFVRILEPDGSVGLTVGEAGEGPGEIRAPIILGVLESPDGSFWVQEAFFAHRFDSEGEFIETVSWEPRIPNGYDYDHDRGLVYTIAMPPPRPDTEGPPPRNLLRYQPGKREPEPVAPWNAVIGAGNDEPGDDKARFASVAVGPRGQIAVVDIWNYRVRVLSPEGSLLTEFGRSDLTRPQKSAERLAEEREWAASRGRQAPDPGLPHLAPWATYDGSGRLWLQSRREPALIDVFDVDGAYLGEVRLEGELQQGYRAIAAHGDRLATVLIGASGQPTVHLWRIVEP